MCIMLKDNYVNIVVYLMFVWYLLSQTTLMLLLIARTKFSDFSGQSHYR